MTDPDQIDDQRYFDALELVEWIVEGFDIETKGEGGRNSSAIGMSGCRIFDTLARKPAPFAGLVPLRYSNLVKESGLSLSTVGKAVNRLIDHLLISVGGPPSGSRSRMAMLYLPPRVVSLYERREQNSAVSSGAVSQDEVRKALAILRGTV